MAANSEHTRILVDKISHLKNESDKIVLVAGRDQERMEIHRVILAAMSNYFERNLGNNYDAIEVVLDDVDGKFLKEIISFSYTGNIGITQAKVPELLDFALKYEFKMLHKKCTEFCERQLSVDNCINWLIFAGQYDMAGVRRNAFQMICTNFERISSIELCKLDFANFKEVLATDENLAREEVIFDHLVEWLRFDELGRAEHALNLLQCIRLKHIPKRVLIEKVMVFCQKYNIVGYTDNECKERLQKPRPVYQSRYAHNRRVFEIHEKGTMLVIRAYDFAWNRWRTAITIRITVTDEMPQKYFGSVFCGTKLYIIGGCTETGKFLKDIEVFDFVSKTCKDLPEMTVARGFFNPIVVGQFIYVFGGYDGIASLRDCERFNTKLERWETLKPMQYGHLSCTVAAVNGYIYVADGNNHYKGCCCTIARYDPSTDEWMKVASVPYVTFEGVLLEWKGFLYAVDVNERGMTRYDCEKNIWVAPVISDGEDEILLSFHRLQLKLFDYYREKVIVKEKEFFQRLCPPNSNEVSLEDFSRNLVLHDMNSQ